MITKNEIDIKAEEFDIHPSNVQRDYVYSWVLFGVYNLSELGDILVLKGGNCLRKAYFKNTRFSSDLDFSVGYSIDLEFLEREFNSICQRIKEIAGIKFDIEKNKYQPKKRADKSLSIYDVRLYFNDFYGKENTVIISVRIDVTQFDKLYLPIQTRKLIHPYSDRENCLVDIKCVKLEEVLASKLKCLIQRRHSSDFYDYAYSLFLSEKFEINKPEVASTFLKKTIFQRSPGAARRLLIGLPFHTLKNLWNKYIVCPVEGRIDFDKAIVDFTDNIKSLFQESIYGTERFFFPPEFRNLILDAGSEKTLLKIKYKSKERLIEPYSLVYKIRQDRVGQEYFYAWDQTGGDFSGPGIKTFTNNRIESLENTDIKFEPRFEIEVAKSGEFSTNSYFGKPFSQNRYKRTAIRTRLGPTYVYECTACGRHFKRKRRNSKMGKHNDNFGNYCYGRSSFLIDIEY